MEDIEIQEKVRRRIQSSRQYDIGRYGYFVWPYKGLSAIEPAELSYLTQSLRELVPTSTQVIITFMTDGDLLAVPLSQIMNLPVIVCRDNDYKMSAPLSFAQNTGYYSRNLFCEIPDKNKPICIVDAIISTGASMVAASKALLNHGCTITGVVAAVEKIGYGGRDFITRELGLKPRVLFSVYKNKNIFRVKKCDNKESTK